MFWALKKKLKLLIDIIYPRYCIVCQKNLKVDSLAELICSECWVKIKRNIPPTCRYCGKHINSSVLDGICETCKKRDYYFDRVYAACNYDGILKELIHQFKYSGKEYLGFILSRLLIEFINKSGLSLECFDFVIPVPLHKRKKREREFNQSYILAKNVAEQFKLVLLKEGLLRIRDTRTQTELPKQKRFKNVKDCFLVNPRVELKGKNILLIDDLLTTGATCSEAAYALKQAGCQQVWVLTLAN